MLILMFLFVPCVLAQDTLYNKSNTGYNAIYVNNLTITLNNTDANVTMDYELDVFTKFYLFMFGGGAIEIELKSILMGFDNITTKEIGEESAVFHIDGVSYCEDGFHVIDSRKLNQEVGNLTVEFTDGTSMRYRNIERVPKIRYLCS